MEWRFELSIEQLKGWFGGREEAWDLVNTFSRSQYSAGQVRYLPYCEVQDGPQALISPFSQSICGLCFRSHRCPRCLGRVDNKWQDDLNVITQKSKVYRNSGVAILSLVSAWATKGTSAGEVEIPRCFTGVASIKLSSGPPWTDDLTPRIPLPGRRFCGGGWR